MTKEGQTLIIAGCYSGSEEDTPTIIIGDSLPQPLPSLNTNAEEADMRIWKHIKESKSNRILVYSPDSDIYNIGLGLIDEIACEVIIQLNPVAQETKFLQLKQLTDSILKDPDMASIISEHRNRIMQTLFIVSGCDYISWIRSIGKSTMLDVFFQHSNFINGSQMRGCLSNTYPGNNMEGFLSFIRLRTINRHHYLNFFHYILYYIVHYIIYILL